MENHLHTYYNFLMLSSQSENKIPRAMQSRYSFNVSSSQYLFLSMQITTFIGSFGRGGEYNIC